MNEDLIENADETHFIINCDNGRTLGFKGDEHVKYADVVSAGVGMTMVVKVSGGQGAKIIAPFMIFQNDGCRYLIHEVPDNIHGVSYRSAANGFMTSQVFA